MPAKLTTTLFIIAVLLITGWYMIAHRNSGSSSLVVPSLSGVQQQTPAPLPDSPPPAYNPPETLKFDASTNLQQELDSINPQVLDSDFE